MTNTNKYGKKQKKIKTMTRLQVRNLIKKAKQEAKTYVDLSPHLLESFIKTQNERNASIKIQVGQKIFN